MHRRAIGMAMLSLLAGCSGAPTKSQTGTMRLIRQADSNYQNGRFDVAKGQYQSLLATNPKFATGHVRLGVIAYHEGDAQTARSEFEVALRIEPRNEQAQYNLAMLHLNDAASLLGEYVQTAPRAASRERVLALLAQLKAFGGRQQDRDN